MTSDRETLDKIAAAALSFVGTPFAHRGRKPGVALDCAGVVLCACWAAGVELPDCIGYGPLPVPSVLMSELADRAWLVHRDDAGPGDVLLFGSGATGRPMHFGILTAPTRFVHAHGTVGRTIEHALSRRWAAHLHSIWRPLRPPVGVVEEGK